MAVISLSQFADEMAKAAAEFPDKVHKVIEESAKAIRDDWRSRWRGLGDAPYLWAAVTYDVYDEGSGSRAEIGPDKSLPQGPLGNLLEFGSINNAPRPGGLYAMEKEEPRLIEAVEDMIVESFEGEAE